jgi:hypothetical protein
MDLLMIFNHQISSKRRIFQKLFENIFPCRKEKILKVVSEYHFFFAQKLFHAESKLCEFCDNCTQLEYPMNFDCILTFFVWRGHFILHNKQMLMKMELQ